MARSSHSPSRDGLKIFENGLAKIIPRTTATRPNLIKILKIFDVNSSAAASPSSFFALLYIGMKPEIIPTATKFAATTGRVLAVV